MKKVTFFVSALVLVGSVFLSSKSTLAEGTYTAIGTADGQDGSQDALNFSQGRVWTIDQYGKYIWTTQVRGGSTHWAFSNDLGANWTQGSQSYGALVRGSVAYDSISDKLHVIWTTNTCSSDGGIIYRRYAITRDGSNNITDILRDDAANINLQLDITGDITCSLPVALWSNDGSTNGSLIAIWTKSGGGRSEVRGSMRQLSLSAADGVAANWTALDGSADSFSVNPPEVAADMIYGDTSGSNASSATIRGGSGARKDDLYVFVQNSHGNSGDRVYAYRAIWNSGSKNWSGGWQSRVEVGAAESGTGYDAKYELITKPVIDPTNDRLYIGWARWKPGGDGDTVSFAYLNSTDTASSVYDAYAALGTHSYAPTLDIAFDNTRQEFYIAYVESTTNGDNGSIDYKVFDGTTLGSQTRFYTSPGGSGGADGSADIPILYQERSSNDRLLFAFRINGALPPTGVDPHTIDWGYITLAAAPTPTPTPTPQSNNQPLTTPSNENVAPTVSCTDSAPAGIPNLFQVDVAGTFVNLNFTTVSGSVNGYQISYGTGNNDSQYGDFYSYSGSKWILNRAVGSLSPNTMYSFKVKAVNGCNAGSWSKTVQIKTKGKMADLTQKFLSLNPFASSPTPAGATSPKPADCTYTVQSGDSLWKIAQSYLGSGAKFGQLVAYNPEIFTGNFSNSLVRIGWKLKVC